MNGGVIMEKSKVNSNSKNFAQEIELLFLFHIIKNFLFSYKLRKLEINKKLN